MSVTVAPETVVSFHYRLRDPAGELLDASAEGEPMDYLHGAGNIVPGLEREMGGKRVGDTFAVVVAAAEGYGERVEGTMVVPRSEFPATELVAGISVVAESPEGETVPLWIESVSDDEVTLSPNHPLAGVDLAFEIEIVAIRAATGEELAHGHPHGPHGHHH